MVLYTCVRLLLRRFALRKGLALTAASLFLLGTIGLYYVLQDGPGGGERARTVRVVSVRVCACVGGGDDKGVWLQACLPHVSMQPQIFHLLLQCN